MGPSPTCHIVESWDKYLNASSDRDVHVYSSGTKISLDLDGKSIGSAPVPSSKGVTFPKVHWEKGTLTATCSGVSTKSGTMTHKRKTSQPGTKLSLRVDAPSPLTGTGKALLADGQDTALLAALIVDDAGNVDHQATNNVTFTVVSGPAKIVASHNGDVANHEPNLGEWHSAYHGMVRGIVRVTQDSASDPSMRARMLYIDVEHAAAPTDVLAPFEARAATEIVVEATSPGLKPGRATIALSSNPADGVLATAAAAVTSPLHIE